MTHAEADPADARRQALEADPLARHVQPVVQMRVLREDLLHLGVGFVNILRIARQGGPAEGADAAAEKRADIGGHETGEGKGVFQPLFQRDLADVVAIVERGHARVPEIDHRGDMHLHAGAGGFLDGLGIALALVAPLGHRPALRQIAVHGVMRAGLIGDDIGMHAAADQLGEDIGGIAQKGDRLGLARLGPALDHLQRLVQRLGLFIDIAGAQAEIDAVGVAFDREAAGAGHHGRQRLRAAHAAEAAGQNPASLEVAIVMLAACLDKGLVCTLHDALAADIDPAAGGHLAIHRQTLFIELVEMIPSRPMRHDVRVGDQHPRRVLVRLKYAHGLARLHQQRLVLFEILEAGHDGVEIVPCARGAPDAAINDKLMRVLGHIGMQVVHQHAHRRFGHPAFRRDVGAGGGVDVARVLAGIAHALPFSVGARSASLVRMSVRWARRRAALASS